ncbi:aerobactin siderophore synthesis protein IucB [Vibrio galatheae]|uniref:Aerobactin siderophore synthesis protein IucB n=1 Tax=Vibrio galatheae TaxID=579748 RepID=A0A0F4NJ93_9VIBR|nr:GNAT family N-acetyltransferase [Vibrio galatheae]KJY82126.1 aerobactin siderophore synthesis protein IucB [Vibrio galatheae]
MPNFNTFVYHDNQTITLTVQPNDFQHPHTLQTLCNEIDQLFNSDSELESLVIEGIDPTFAPLLATHLPIVAGKLTRHAFFQAPLFWHQHKTSTGFPKHLVQSDSRYRHHPLRPPMPSGRVYKRHDFDAQSDVSFRLIEIERDLDRFTRWMNDPRVAHFWEQAWNEERLAEFLTQRLADPHIIPLIGEFNGQPFGYIEAYWVAEDRLSPYYDVHDYDRGIHLLVGEQEFRGPKYFNAWIKAISHYLFLDDVRTQRIVLEPRADNERLFNRILSMGYQKQFEFNFPHKRSALLMLTRDEFFAEQW